MECQVIEWMRNKSRGCMITWQQLRCITSHSNKSCNHLPHHSLCDSSERKSKNRYHTRTWQGSDLSTMNEWNHEIESQLIIILSCMVFSKVMFSVKRTTEETLLSSFFSCSLCVVSCLFNSLSIEVHQKEWPPTLLYCVLPWCTA